MSERWYTCTPVAFGGGPDFFSRDSGLMCRGFQAIGCESRAVMPGDAQAEDEPDLIRTKFANLESPAWWKSHQLDGVVLYAWGSPKFRKVAAAIRQAGVFLILNQDNGGLISPLAGFSGWVAEQRNLTESGPAFMKLLARGFTRGLLVTDPLRAAHLQQGDVIACVSPVAASHYRKLCRIYGGDRLAARVEVLPHPVESIFQFDGEPDFKSRQVVCVGRWQERIQKRPDLMMEVLQSLVEQDATVRVEIVGTKTPGLEAWHLNLPEKFRNRIRLRGRVDRVQLCGILRTSQVFYSASAFESFGIAAGEALCSGCSVVGGRSPSMASFEWFTSERSGRLAVENDAPGHLAALKDELTSWEQGERNPISISKTWASRLHAEQVAMRALELRMTRPKPN
ncbi:MAG: glycosyltransferase [Verrucomicrobiota bacterium]